MLDPVNPNPTDPKDSPDNVTPDSATPDSPTPADLAPKQDSPDNPADPAQTPAPADPANPDPSDPATPDSPAQTPPAEPFVDPMDSLLGDEETGEPKPTPNLTGEQHFNHAVEKKFDELKDGIAEGKPEALLAFRSLKPQTQEAVAKKFQLHGEPVNSAKEMLDFLDTEFGKAPKVEPKDVFTDKDGEVVKANLNFQFSAQAEKLGLKFDELKKSGEYASVVKSASEKIAFIKANNLPASAFETLFNFENEFAVATLKTQNDKAYQEGLNQRTKIDGATETTPTNNAAHQPGGQTPKAGAKVNSTDYYESTDEAWKAEYRKTHEKDGILEFADS